MRRAVSTILLLLGGCSSYKVVKLGSDGAIPAEAGGGVPVTLGRPQFVVRKIEGSDPEQYQVAVTYVPDPDQRYAVRIGSTPLANAELSLAFSDGGALSSSTATVKDQLVPTTLALFKVAASAAAAFGPAGFLDAAAPTTLTDCLPAGSDASQGARIRCALTILAAAPAGKCRVAVGPDGLIDRLKPFIDAEQKDRGDPAKSLFARDQAEKDCLLEAKGRLTDLVDGDTLLQPTGLVTSLKGALATVGAAARPSGIPATVRDAASEALTAAIAKGDVTTLKRWFYVTGDPALTQQRLERLVPAAAAPVLSDAKVLNDVLSAQELAPGKTGLERVRRVGEAKALASLFGDAAELEPAAWRARYVVFLQRKANEAERVALQAAPQGDARLDPTVRGYRERIAALSGVRAEYDRLMQYLLLLRTLPSRPSPGQRLSPAAEYEGARAQSAALEQAIAAAIAARLASEPAKKPDPLPPSSPWMAVSCVAQSQDEAWRYRTGVDAAPFAIVLRRADGTSIAPPNGALQCAG